MGKYSAVVEALINRLTRHCETDGILAGWKFTFEPTADVEGKKDLPSIRFFDLPQTQEPLSPVLITDGNMTLQLLVATSRKVGVVQFVKDIETVLDAISLNDDEEPDLSLDQTLSTPLALSSTDAFANDISLNAVIQIVARPLPVIPGSRRS